MFVILFSIRILTFYLDDHNEFIFNNIGILNQTSSAYFRNLITRYLMLPEYKRECIIYLDIVEQIQTAIKNKNLVTLELDKRIFQFAPYKIATTKEELYSYLIGYDRAKVEAIHISKIKNIMIENKTIHFTEEQEKILELNIEKGVQFAENTLCHAVIEFTNRGMKLFSQRYLHRPIPSEINGNRYTFYCSFTQLLFYFISFGGGIKVIEPKSLGNKIYSEYKTYIRQYKQEKYKVESK